MVYEESVSECSKGALRGASASGESVGTGIDGHPSMSNKLQHEIFKSTFKNQIIMQTEN